MHKVIKTVLQLVLDLELGLGFTHIFVIFEEGVVGGL